MKLKNLLGLLLMAVFINMTYANISYTNKIENQNTAVQIQMFISAPELYSPPDIAVIRVVQQKNSCLVNSLSVEAKKNMAARPPDIVAVVAMSENRFNVKEVNMGVVDPPDIVLFANEETDRTIIQAEIIKPPDIIVAMAHHDALNTQVKENSSASTKKTTFHLNEKIHVTSTKSDQYVLHDVSHHLRC